MKKISIAVLLILAFCTTCYAQDITLSISCTIPSIPGVNAPALETQPPAPEPQVAAARQAQMEEALAQAATSAQSTILAQTMSGAMMVQTVYGR